MKPNILSRKDALNDGAELWILPTFRFSEWTRRLDWPLNLQITKSIHHKTKPLSPRMEEILQTYEIKPESITTRGPLLIASDGLLPNRWTVVVDADQWEPWQKESLKVWKQLGEPSVRLFIPSFANWEKGKSQWPESLQIVESGGVA